MRKRILLYLEKIGIFLVNNKNSIEPTMAILSVIGIFLAAFLAFQIGITQNEINQKAIEIQDFVELFFMPQQQINQIQDENGVNNISVSWNILIKNASSMPIYLEEYSLGDKTTIVGKVALPNNTDSWYYVPIPLDVQQTGKFELLVKYEDYLGRKYSSKSTGILENSVWKISGEKRIRLN